MKNMVGGTMKTFAFAVCALLLISASVTAGDWPNWRGPNYDGISTESNFNTQLPEAGPKVLWEKQIGTGFSAVSVSGGNAYVMGNADDKDTVFCFDAFSGQEKWTHTYDQRLDPKNYEGGTLATPTVKDGKVYTISKDGITFCLDAADGSVIWEKDISKEYGFKRPAWGYSCSPVIIDDLMLLNAGRYGSALNIKDGSLVWGTDKSPCGYSSMVPFTRDGKQCVAMFGFKEVVAMEAATGQQLWQYTWETKYDINAADPIIDGDNIYISSGYGHGSARLKITGSKVDLVWETEDLACKMSGPVLIDGALYGPSEKKGLQCLDAETGKLLWEEPEYKQGTIMAAGGKLIVMSEKGTLAIANPSKDKFDVISSAQVLDGKCWTVPTLANGKLYVRNSKGTLKCLDLSPIGAKDIKKNDTLAYWPQWQGPNKDAISTDTGLLKKWPEGGPEMLWSVDGIGAGFSSIVTDGSTIYIGGMVDKQGIVTALEMDGTVKWRKPYSQEWSKSFPGTRASVTIAGDKLYIFSGTGIATCLDADTGEKIWSVDVVEKFGGQHHMWGYGESLLVVDDKVICTAGGEGASIVALDVNDGSLVWKTDDLSEKASYTSPIVIETGGKKVIIQFLWQNIVAVDAADGTLISKYDKKNYEPAEEKRGRDIHPNTPLYHDGYIFIASGYDSGSAKLKISEDATEITKVWQNHDFDVHHGGFVLVDGYLYGSNWISNSKGDWLCVNWETGETAYTHNWDENKGSIGYADGMLYCYQEDKGNLALVRPTPEKFEIISSFPITQGQEKHWAHPIICGGVLYVRHGDVLMAYDVKI